MASDVGEAVGVFTDATALERAVQDLLTERGFDHSDVSLLAADQAVEQRLGRVYRDSRAAEDDPAAPRRGWVAPEARAEGRGALAGVLGYIGAMTAGAVSLASGAAAPVVVVAAALGGGALAGLGFALGRLLDHRLAATLERQARRGGIVLWVRAGDDGRAAIAQEALIRHGARDVHLHVAPERR